MPPPHRLSRSGALAGRGAGARVRSRAQRDPLRRPAVSIRSDRHARCVDRARRIDPARLRELSHLGPAHSAGEGAGATRERRGDPRNESARLFRSVLPHREAHRASGGEPSSAARAVTDPSRSDVRLGETRTELSGAGHGRTRVIYRTRIVPGFWVPAFGGRRWLLNTLEAATEQLFRTSRRRQARKSGQRCDAAAMIEGSRDRA